MKRDLIYAAVLWIVVTVLGEWALANLDYFPLRAAVEAHIVDEAFHLLMVLGLPVLTFVVVGMVYAILRFRADDDAADGPPIFTHNGLTWGWFVVTSALAIYVIVDPGITGLRKLTANQQQDLVVQVEATQWQWSYAYPQYDVILEDADELVLPVDRRAKFEITATDVIHSFWVPAFRMKLDAVPGQTNVMYVTPDRVVSFEDDPGVRVQCAELCGTGHPRMRTGLRVVTVEEFEAWIEGQ